MIGDRINRIEGKLKVTGTAKYAVEYPLENIAYGMLVTSTIAKGFIKNIYTDQAKASPGVLDILSCFNRPDIPGYHKPIDENKARYYGKEYRLFADNRIVHYNQPVALVIAETLESARHASSLIKVEYQEYPHETSLLSNLDKSITPHRPSDSFKGNSAALDTSAVQIEQEYHTPVQVHNSMEPHAATAWWKSPAQLHIFNKTQFVQSTVAAFAEYFNLEKDNVIVNSPFVGGAFGSASRVWPHEMAAVMGALKVGRPVRVALNRDQVFNMVGYRPQAVQRIKIGADRQGKFLGIKHEAWGSTSSYEEFVERITDPTKSMYNWPHIQTSYRLVPLDVSTPTHARGPGETTGSFALESAVDELSYQLRIDPIQLRIKNFAAIDPDNGLPWTSNHLKLCYEKGALLFGWDKRKPEPGSMKSGEYLLGMGMSAGIYKATREPSTASAQLNSDGTYTIKTSVADTGPGSATVFAQIAADTLGVDILAVKFLWGNSSFPPAPGQFGSHTTASVGSAVYEVCMELKDKIRDYRRAGTIPKEILVTKESASAEGEKKYSGKSFCANFVEVLVHPLTGTVKVNRVVSAVDCGRVMNHKTAESQVLGSIVWGIGISLMEEGITDHRTGSYVNNNLADYHVPVHADMPDIKIHFIDKEDKILDPIGAKGLGEIGLIGFTAAVANAVYHATGKRIRNLPITPDKMI